MKLIYLWLLIILLFAAGCGPADRGEPCGEDNSHRSIKCADGLACVWQNSIQRQVCAAPGDEATLCEADEDCHGNIFFCFKNVCATERKEDQSCVTDRQCKGQLVCSVYVLEPYRISNCWPKEKADALDQCYDACLDDYYESCMTACRERGEDEAVCNEVCELVERSRAWITETSRCYYDCL